jgi:hypothetical protein
MAGCGSHAYRNVLPVLRYIPEFELHACCDLNPAKAELFAVLQRRHRNQHACAPDSPSPSALVMSGQRGKVTPAH